MGVPIIPLSISVDGMPTWAKVTIACFYIGIGVVIFAYGISDLMRKKKKRK